MQEMKFECITSDSVFFFSKHVPWKCLAFWRADADSSLKLAKKHNLEVCVGIAFGRDSGRVSIRFYECHLHTHLTGGLFISQTGDIISKAKYHSP